MVNRAGTTKYVPTMKGATLRPSKTLAPSPKQLMLNESFTDELDNLDLVDSATEGLFIEDSDTANFNGDTVE